MVGRRRPRAVIWGLGELVNARSNKHGEICGLTNRFDDVAQAGWGLLAHALESDIGWDQELAG